MPIIDVWLKHMTPTTVRQYQREERAMIASRIRYQHIQVEDLLSIMTEATLSKPESVKILREELAEHYQDDSFLTCESMGELVKTSLDLLAEKY